MPPKKRNRKDAGLEKYEEEFRSLADEQLRRALTDVGVNPGPIDSSNRDIYIRLLVRKKIKLETESSTHSLPTSSSSSQDELLSLSKSSKSSPDRKKEAKASSPLTRPPLVTSKALPLYQTSKLSASPILTAKTRVSQSFEVKGLVAAVYTPFNSDGELSLSVIKTYVNFLLKQGVTSVFVCGSTGESLSLTVVERKMVAEEWMKASGGRLQIIVHVGTQSLKSTCELASHAESLGAAAIGVMPPTFFKPQSLDALVLYLQKVGEAAPNTPMYYYHIPDMTGVRLPMTELVERASTDIPTLRGLKYTDKDLMQLSRIAECERGKYNLMYGSDEQLLGALSMGVSAAVGSTYNYCGRLNNRLIQAYSKGDMETALQEQRRSQGAIALLLKYGGIVAGKAIMSMCGIDVGPPRLPLLPLSIDDHRSLEKELQSLGFFDWN